MRQAKHPAAWINTVYEGGDFDEAIGYLQKTWDDLIDAESRVMHARSVIGELRTRLHVSGRRPEECYEMSLCDEFLSE